MNDNLTDQSYSVKLVDNKNQIRKGWQNKIKFKRVSKDLSNTGFDFSMD
jgi:hypothetical protein